MPGWDGVVHCEVTEVDGPNLLAYSWRSSNMRKTTTVTWRLSEVDTGTRLRLDHQGFAGMAGVILAFMHRAGWRTIVRSRLVGRLDRTASRPD